MSDDAVHSINCGMSRAAITFHKNQRLNLGNYHHKENPHNIFSYQIDETLKERQMRYQKIIEALNRIFYLIGKQKISYGGTQETTMAIVRIAIYCYF